MNRKRYLDLEIKNAELSNKEINEGWHFCTEWDFMLIHSTWVEFECCNCNNVVNNRNVELGIVTNG